MVNADWLIIANGERLSIEKLQLLAQNKQIVVLDGALSQALYDFITPHFVLGDFDSIDTALLESLKQQPKISLIHAPDQSATDLEKALQYIVQYQPNSVTICQATGLRLDHTLHNLRLLKRYHGVCNRLLMLTEIEKIVFLKDQSVSLSVNSQQSLALMAFPKAIVTSHGLEYDMQDYLLEFAECESTSNSVLASGATIDVDGDALLIVSHETELQR